MRNTSHHCTKEENQINGNSMIQRRELSAVTIQKKNHYGQYHSACASCAEVRVEFDYNPQENYHLMNSTIQRSVFTLYERTFSFNMYTC